MASIKYSALVSDMRGKLNGSVMSRNAYGGYIRNKTNPVNTNTEAQQNVRQNMADLSTAWGVLTDAQRAQWNEAALQAKRINIFGDNAPLTGFNLFMRVNRNLDTGGVAQLNSPNMVETPEVVTALTISEASVAADLEITYAPTPVPANHKLFVYATVGVSPGVSFVKSEYRFIKAIAAAAASPQVLTTEYNAVFGTMIADTKIFVKVKLVNTLSGLESPIFSTSAIVTA